MNEKKTPKTLIALQELREEAMKKQLEDILPLVEAEVDRIDPTNLPDGFESDPGLYSFLKKYAYKEPPAHLEEKVMKAVFKNDYKPKTTNNANNVNSYWNPFLVQNLRPLMYSFAGLFVIVLATIAYYQYIEPQNQTIGITANQKTPIIKATPSLTNTPVTAPSPVETINSDMKKSPERSNDTITVDEVTQQKSRDQYENKSVGNTNDYKNSEMKELTQNKINSNSVKSIRDLSKKNNLRSVALKDVSLGELTNFYINPDFGSTQNDKELRQILVKVLENVDINLLTVDEALVEDTYGKITKKDNCIQILNSVNKKLLWEKCITNIEKVSKQDVEKIVIELMKDYSNLQKQNTKKSNLK